jgi:hypothetical protein
MYPIHHTLWFTPLCQTARRNAYIRVTLKSLNAFIVCVVTLVHVGVVHDG